MRDILTFISLFVLHLAAKGQQGNWFTYNDSAIKKTCDYYSSYCTSLNSNKTVSKKTIKRDKKIVAIANRLYAISTIEELEKIKHGAGKYDTTHIFRDTVLPICFHPISDGNLALLFQAAEVNKVLIRKRIVIGTTQKRVVRKRMNVVCRSLTLFTSKIISLKTSTSQCLFKLIYLLSK